MKRLLLAAIVGTALVAGCTDDDRSRETLQNFGFKNIQLQGYDWWGCGDDYTYQTRFSAINPSGAPVHGTVCCGYLKGCSIKF